MNHILNTYFIKAMLLDQLALALSKTNVDDIFTRIAINDSNLG